MDATIDREALHRYVDRVLALHEERRELNASISGVYEEAKSAGFVTGIIRQIVREQQMEVDERELHYALMHSYRHALGMLADTPLGQAAMSTAAVEPPPAPAPAKRPRRTFAEQPVHRAKRPGRPKKRVDLLTNAEPAGAA